MGLLKKRNDLITIVNNEELRFVDPDTPGEGRVIDSLPLAQFLTGDTAIHIIPEKMKHSQDLMRLAQRFFISSTNRFGNVTLKAITVNK